jgi:hypothetical protein
MKELDEMVRDFTSTPRSKSEVRRRIKSYVGAVQQDNDELNRLFRLQQTRMHEATAAWRKANPGNELVLPDLGDLLTWLLAQIPKEG